MSENKSNKWLIYVVAGTVLSAVCGLLIAIGLILSWPHSLADALKFVSHPTTLLFFVGLALVGRGIYLAK